MIEWFYQEHYNNQCHISLTLYNDLRGAESHKYPLSLFEGPFYCAFESHTVVQEQTSLSFLLSLYWLLFGA